MTELETIISKMKMSLVELNTEFEQTEESMNLEMGQLRLFRKRDRWVEMNPGLSVFPPNM